MAVLKRKKTFNTDLDRADKVKSPEELLTFALENQIDTNPLDIETLIRSLNIVLRIHPLPDQKSGYMRYEDGRWVIGVNSLHHPNRQRFTMAHELGHYFLHRHEIGNVEDTILLREGSDFKNDPIENQANDFASRLLMPEDIFRDLITRRQGNVTEIAKDFKVSNAALRLRGRSLGYQVG